MRNGNGRPQAWKRDRVGEWIGDLRNREGNGWGTNRVNTLSAFFWLGLAVKGKNLEFCPMPIAQGQPPHLREFLVSSLMQTLTCPSGNDQSRHSNLLFPTFCCLRPDSQLNTNDIMRPHSEIFLVPSMFTAACLLLLA